MTLSLQRRDNTNVLVLLRLLPLVLTVLLLSAMPVMATGFAEIFDAANKARAEGRFEDAEQQYREALSLSPDNADVLLLLGIVLGYLERYEEALTILNKGIALAPGYTDIRIAAARIKLWMGRPDETRADIESILGVNPDNNAARKLQNQLTELSGKAREMPLWRLDLGYDQSRFNRVNRKNWHEGYTQISHGTKQTQTHIRAERGRRFGEFDTFLRAGIAHRLNDDFGGYINYGITPAASFYPRWKAEAGADYRLLNGGDLIGPTIIKLDLAQKDYATGDIRNIDPGLQQYLFDGKVWLTGRWINTYDLEPSKRLSGWSFRADWQALETIGLFGGISSSAETDSDTSVVTLARFAGVRLDITPDIGLNFAFTRDNRKNTYIRDVFSSGLSLRF